MRSHSKSFKWDWILANGSLSSFHFTVFTVKNKSASFPFTLSILYFRLLMHFLQGDQSESSSIKSNLEWKRGGLLPQEEARQAGSNWPEEDQGWWEDCWGQRSLRIRNQDFVSEIFISVWLQIHCCHIQEGSCKLPWLGTLKKTLKTQELSQKRKKMQSLNNRRRLKQKRKRVALRIRSSLPRSFRGRRKEAKTKEKAVMDVFEGEAKLQKKN